MDNGRSRSGVSASTAAAASGEGYGDGNEQQIEDAWNAREAIHGDSLSAARIYRAAFMFEMLKLRRLPLGRKAVDWSMTPSAKDVRDLPEKIK